MGTIIIILLVAAGIGGLIGLLTGGTKEDVAGAALGGAMYAGSCLFQLAGLAIAVMLGLWVLSWIF